MAATTGFGGGSTNRTSYASGAGHIVYSDYGGIWPTGNPSSDGGAPVTIHSVSVNGLTGGYATLGSLGGGAARVHCVSTTSGDMWFGRLNDNGVNTIDAQDGSAYSPRGGLVGSFTWSTVPQAPTMMSATKLADGKMRVTFSGNHDGYGGISGWQLQYASNSGFSGAVTVASNGTSDLSLTPATLYYFRARGGNGNGWGAWSGAISATTASAPSAPTLASVSQLSPVSFKATWTAPSSDGGASITGYRLQYATNSSFTNATTVNLGNVLTYTMPNGNPGYQYFVRVAAINGAIGLGASVVYSSTKSVVLVTEIGDLDGWAVYGTLPANTAPLIGTGLRRGGVIPVPGKTGLIREIQATGAGTVVASSIGIERPFANLTVGATYKLTGKAVVVSDTTPAANQYAFGVTGMTTGSSVTVTDSSTPETMAEYTFTATATSHTIRIIMTEGTSYTGDWFEAVAFYDIKLTEIPPASPYRLQDTVYEGPLSTHFDYACASVGAAWWVDRENVTRFRQADSQDAIVATFTDTRAPGALEYVDIAASFDTKNAINMLQVNNHGRDAVSGNASDVTYVASDSASIDTWGPRSGSMDMTLRTGYTDRTNFVTNPAMAVDTTGYSLVQATGTGNLSRIVINFNGLPPYAIRYNVATAAGTWWGVRFASVPVTAGLSYAFVASGRPSVAKTTHVVIQWINGSGSLISETLGAITAHTANSFQSRSVFGTAPAGATTARLEFRVSNAGSIGNILDVTGFLFEQSATVGTFFYGGTAADPVNAFKYAWTGTENASSSIRTVHHVDLRVADILGDFSEAQQIITRVRWNAQENPIIASALDIQDRVRVEFRGTVQDSRIIGIKHDFSSGRWMTDLELVRSES